MDILLCKTSSTSFLSPLVILICLNVAESISDRSGSEMNSALNALEFPKLLFLQ